MALNTYKRNDSLYKLNALKYTDLNDVSNNDTNNKNIISNSSTESKQTIIKDNLPITNSVQNMLSDSQNEDSAEEIEDIFVEQKNPFNSNSSVYVHL